MPERELSQLMADLGDLIDRQGGQIGELRTTVDEQNAQLAHFVPKRRFRVVIGVAALVLLILVGIAVSFRVRDDAEAKSRREQIERDQEQDRQNNIAGCERANDQRAALRRTIERAYAPSTISDDVVASLPPALREALAQSAERQAAQRAEQLSDPGVQHVDCQAKYPAPESGRAKS